MPSLRSIAFAALLLGASPMAGARAERPIAEPAFDDGANHLVRDGTWAMTVYQLRKLVDPSVAGAMLHLVPPREAADVDALDEVPDSSWFTNRHARRRVSAAALARGPNGDRAPAADGPLVVTAAKPRGMSAGFVVRDAKGDRYVVKLDPPGYPEVPTGAEMVCTKILHALGWNVPENYLVAIDPRRLVADPEAEARDGSGHARTLGADDVRAIVARAARRPDGTLRAVASRWVAGIPKGGFRTLGRRADDPNDVVPHEDRRELRGLRVVAAWINYTDARRGNFLDTFVPDPARDDGRGRLVHYLLDFSSALGAGNDDWKSPRYGHEYFFDPVHALERVVTLGQAPPWTHVPLAHPALGYFDADTFDPEAWRTTYPNPLFDAATARDAFWGAKLVSAFTDADLAVMARAGEWSDPRAAEVLAGLLRARQRKIARAFFDARRIDPIDGFVVEPVARSAPVADATACGPRGGACAPARVRLRFHDLAVENAVADPADARYRRRVAGGEWVAAATADVVPLAALPTVVELATSHDGGTQWSPPTRVTIDAVERGLAVTAIERATR